MALQAEQQQEIPHQVRTRLDLGVVNLTVRSLRLKSTVTEEETYPWFPGFMRSYMAFFATHARLHAAQSPRANKGRRTSYAFMDRDIIGEAGNGHFTHLRLD